MNNEAPVLTRRSFDPRSYLGLSMANLKLVRTEQHDANQPPARPPLPTDAEALDAFQYLSRCEGIIPALESAHAIAHTRKLAPTLGRGAIVIVNLSGRGDKDAPQVRELLRGKPGTAH